MILPFTQKIENKPTHFAEKIWKAIDDFDLITKEEAIEFSNNQKKSFVLDYPLIPNLKPKLHTIRADKKNRWSESKKIHPVYNNTRPNMFQFAPTMKCVSIQEIKIVKAGTLGLVWIDNIPMGSEKVKSLAVNDGFDSLIDFFLHFKEDFEGKIIHWTNLKY